MGKAQEVVDAITDLAAADQHQIPAPVWMLDTEGLLEAKNRLDALIAVRLQAGEVRGVTVAEAGRTTTGWLVEEQRLSRRDAQRRMWLASQLPAHPEIADAFAAGEISGEHARLIISGLKSLDPSWRDAARVELLECARCYDPGFLAALIRAVKVRSGATESAEAAAERIHSSRYLNLHDTFDGAVRIDGMLDPAGAATIRAALEPLLGDLSGHDDRTSTQRRADALVALAEQSLRLTDLPDDLTAVALGGNRPQLIATIPYDQLRDGISATQLTHATLNGISITPATARMLACDAQIIPAVLGARGEILDLGRATRTWSTAQRRAAALRDQHCVFPRCQTRLDHCHLHHLRHWANGGPSDHHNSAHLCRFHHWLVHHTPWTITRNTNGTIQVHRT